MTWVRRESAQNQLAQRDYADAWVFTPKRITYTLWLPRLDWVNPLPAKLRER